MLISLSRRFTRLAASAILLASSIGTPVVAQEWSDWKRFNDVDGVRISYAVKVSDNQFRIAWRCENNNDYPVSCEIGSGDGNKYYRCISNGVEVRTDSMSGEMATVGAHREYSFPSDWACQGFTRGGVTPRYDLGVTIKRLR